MFCCWQGARIRAWRSGVADGARRRHNWRENYYYVCNISVLIAKKRRQEVVDVSISQIVGDEPKVAWDILPLTIKEVAEATKTDRVYSKLYRSIKAGFLNKNDKDVSKFNGVFIIFLKDSSFNSLIKLTINFISPGSL